MSLEHRAVGRDSHESSTNLIGLMTPLIKASLSLAAIAFEETSCLRRRCRCVALLC